MGHRQDGFQRSKFISLWCSGWSNIFSLQFWVHEIFFAHFLLTPCKHLVNIRRLNSNNFCNTPDDHQAIWDILRHVTVREIWHDFAVFSCLDWMLDSLKGSIGLYCLVKGRLIWDVMRITSRKPQMNMDNLCRGRVDAKNQNQNLCSPPNLIDFALLRVQLCLIIFYLKLGWFCVPKMALYDFVKS